MRHENLLQELVRLRKANLVQRWRKKYDEGEEGLEEAYANLQNALDKINKTHSRDDIHFIDESLKKREQDILRNIHDILNGEARLLGSGLTAKVFVEQGSSREKNYCLKVISDSSASEYTKNNNIKQELSFLVELHDLNVEGARAPKPFCYAMIKDAHVLIMEKVEGVTLSSILEKINDLPKNFNINEFFDKLRKYISRLHAMGIHHRDLHAGNIMIEKTTHEPGKISWLILLFYFHFSLQIF